MSKRYIIKDLTTSDNTIIPKGTIIELLSFIFEDGDLGLHYADILINATHYIVDKIEFDKDTVPLTFEIIMDILYGELPCLTSIEDVEALLREMV